MARVHWKQAEREAIALHFVDIPGHFRQAMNQAQIKAGIAENRRRDVMGHSEVPWLKPLLEEVSGAAEAIRIEEERQRVEQARIEKAIETEKARELREREKEAMKQEILESLSFEDIVRGFKHHIYLMVENAVELGFRLRDPAIDVKDEVIQTPSPAETPRKHNPIPKSEPHVEQKRYLIIGPKPSQAPMIKTAFPHVKHMRIMHPTDFNNRHVEGHFDVIVIMNKFVKGAVASIIRDRWHHATFKYFEGSAADLPTYLTTILPPKPRR